MIDMPITVNGKLVSSEEVKELLQKKAKRPKYTLNEKKADEIYSEATLLIDGKKKKLSKSSNYMLDMISDDEEGN